MAALSRATIVFEEHTFPSPAVHLEVSAPGGQNESTLPFSENDLRMTLDNSVNKALDAHTVGSMK